MCSKYLILEEDRVGYNKRKAASPRRERCFMFRLVQELFRFDFRGRFGWGVLIRLVGFAVDRAELLGAERLSR